MASHANFSANILEEIADYQCSDHAVLNDESVLIRRIHVEEEREVTKEEMVSNRRSSSEPC